MRKILRADRTLYMLNDKGDENTFSAFVQPGRERTIQQALEIAKDIELCVNSHDALVKAAKYAAAVLSGNDLSKSGLVIALESIRDALSAAGAPQ